MIVNLNKEHRPTGTSAAYIMFAYESLIPGCNIVVMEKNDKFTRAAFWLMNASRSYISEKTTVSLFIQHKEGEGKDPRLYNSFIGNISTLPHQCSTLVIDSATKPARYALPRSFVLDLVEDIAKCMHYTKIFGSVNSQDTKKALIEKFGFEELVAFKNRRTDRTVSYLTKNIDGVLIKDLKIYKKYGDLNIESSPVIVDF